MDKDILKTKDNSIWKGSGRGSDVGFSDHPAAIVRWQNPLSWCNGRVSEECKVILRYVGGCLYVWNLSSLRDFASVLCQETSNKRSEKKHSFNMYNKSIHNIAELMWSYVHVMLYKFW